MIPVREIFGAAELNFFLNDVRQKRSIHVTRMEAKGAERAQIAHSMVGPEGFEPPNQGIMSPDPSP